MSPVTCIICLLPILILVPIASVFAADDPVSPQKRSSQVAVGINGELRVNDRPFLPIFVWLQPIRNFDFLIPLGINTFMGEGAGGGTAKEFLDAAEARGVWGIIHSHERRWELKDHPALLCWMFGDEPDMPAKSDSQDEKRTPRVLPDEIVRQYRTLKAVDTDHPAYLNLTSGFFDQFAWYDEAIYRHYCQATDIVGYDFYPVTGWGKPEWVSLIGTGTRKLVALAGPRVPVWAILECTTKLRWVSQEKLNRIEHPQGARDFELRGMVWLAVINGAKGIGYFPHRWEPYKQAEISEELQAEMKRTNRQLTELAPAILSPEAAEQVSCEALNGGPVNTMIRKYGGRLYVFAVNTSLKPAHVRFTLPSSFKTGEVGIYEDQRRILAQNSEFEDVLDKLGVRIYIVGH